MEEAYIVNSEHLTKRYRTTEALKDVDIRVKRGSIYGLVGNNGAGKTTFLKLLAGHIQRTSGFFTLFGEGTEAGYRKARSRMGAIIENPGFYAKLTCRQNLEYYRIQRGIPGKDTVDKMLDQVGLTAAAGKKFENLSLGMKQRLGLALALMGEPELLILDEPINGLDPMGIIEIRNLLLKMNHENNITVLISSHILSELENIATDYGFLNKGCLAEQISAEQLRDKCSNYLEVKVTDAAKYTALLESSLQYTDYKVLPGNVVHMMGDISRLSDYSALAVNNGIGLLSFEMREINLENYYMNLIGAANQPEGKQVAAC